MNAIQKQSKKAAFAFVICRQSCLYLTAAAAHFSEVERFV